MLSDLSGTDILLLAEYRSNIRALLLPDASDRLVKRLDPCFVDTQTSCQLVLFR